jgi:hypothetical protein
MPTDATYTPGVYRTQGGGKLVVGATGRLSSAAGTSTQNPTTGTLITHITSATLAGNDFAGTISVVSDSTGVAANAGICTVTFATVRTTAPIVILVNLTGGAAGTTTYPGTWYAGAVTTTGFTVMNSLLTTASSTYLIGYVVIDVE